MSKQTVIEVMLDQIEWQKYEGTTSAKDGLPYATHEGILWISEMPIRVYQLSDGRRVFAAEDSEKLFGIVHP